VCVCVCVCVCERGELVRTIPLPPHNRCYSCTPAYYLNLRCDRSHTRQGEIRSKRSACRIQRSVPNPPLRPKHASLALLSPHPFDLPPKNKPERPLLASSGCALALPRLISRFAAQVSSLSHSLTLFTLSLSHLPGTTRGGTPKGKRLPRRTRSPCKWPR